MHLAINKKAADIFRSAATAMASKTRAYAGAEAAAAADLVDAELTRIIKGVVSTEAKRAQGGGRYNTDPMTEQLEMELMRMKNDAVRDLKHLPLDVPIGSVSVTVTGNQGPVSVAAGHGNRSTQLVKGTSSQDLLGIIGLIRADLAAKSIDQDRMIDITDEIERLKQEAAKPVLDRSRLARFAKRVVETTEKVGVAIAPNLLDLLIKAVQ
jgi:uncharacterized protein (DUF2252 family)